jgi:hypothetical protein
MLLFGALFGITKSMVGLGNVDNTPERKVCYTNSSGNATDSTKLQAVVLNFKRNSCNIFIKYRFNIIIFFMHM